MRSLLSLQVLLVVGAALAAVADDDHNKNDGCADRLID